MIYKNDTNFLCLLRILYAPITKNVQDYFNKETLP